MGMGLLPLFFSCEMYSLIRSDLVEKTKAMNNVLCKFLD